QPTTTALISTLATIHCFKRRTQNLRPPMVPVLGPHRQGAHPGVRPTHHDILDGLLSPWLPLASRRSRSPCSPFAGPRGLSAASGFAASFSSFSPVSLPEPGRKVKVDLAWSCSGSTVPTPG